jgi:hypothetical protein
MVAIIVRRSIAVILGYPQGRIPFDPHQPSVPGTPTLSRKFDFLRCYWGNVAREGCGFDQHFSRDFTPRSDKHQPLTREIREIAAVWNENYRAILIASWQLHVLLS